VKVGLENPVCQLHDGEMHMIIQSSVLIHYQRVKLRSSTAECDKNFNISTSFSEENSDIC